jgi:hypothetical protein
MGCVSKTTVCLLANGLLFLVVNSLVYSTIYSSVALTVFLTLTSFATKISIDLGILDLSYGVELTDGEYGKFILYNLIQLLLIINACATHHSDSVVARLAILVTWHFVFLLAMYFEEGVYIALKSRIFKAYKKGLDIVWICGYSYIMSIVLLMPIIFTALGIPYLTDIGPTVTGLMANMISIVLGISLIISKIDSLKIRLYKCGHIAAIATSITVFTSSIIINSIINIIILSRLNNTYLITIGSFTAVFIVNMALLVSMLLVHQMLLYYCFPQDMAVSCIDQLYHNSDPPPYEPPQYMEY